MSTCNASCLIAPERRQRIGTQTKWSEQHLQGQRRLLAWPRDGWREGRRSPGPAARPGEDRGRCDSQSSSSRAGTGQRHGPEAGATLDGRKVACALGREHRRARGPRQHSCRVSGGCPSAPDSGRWRASPRPLGAGALGDALRPNDGQRQRGRHRSPGASNCPHGTRRGGAPGASHEESGRVSQAATTSGYRGAAVFRPRGTSDPSRGSIAAKRCPVGGSARSRTEAGRSAWPEVVGCGFGQRHADGATSSLAAEMAAWMRRAVWPEDAWALPRTCE
jgi:hypothetical protein